MIELLNNDQRLMNAIENARANRKSLLVRVTSEARKYLVLNKNTGNCYTTSFFVQPDGRKFGSCNCKAGQFNRICRHIAAAAGLNMCLAERGYFINLN